MLLKIHNRMLKPFLNWALKIINTKNKCRQSKTWMSIFALGSNCFGWNRSVQLCLLWRKYLFRIHFRRSSDTRHRVGNIWRIKFRDSIRLIGHRNIKWLISSSICRSSRRLIRYWLCICFDSCRWSKDHWSIYKLSSYNKLN